MLPAAILHLIIPQTSVALTDIAPWHPLLENANYRVTIMHLQAKQECRGPAWKAANLPSLGVV
jgi:hypothetical protein